MRLKSEAPKVGRHRAKELNGSTKVIRGLRSTGLLLKNHVEHPTQQRTSERPIPPPSPTSKPESLNQRSAFTYLKSGEMAPITNRPPLESAEKIFLETGVNFGRLQAIIRPPNSEPFYCFDQSTYNQGEKTGKYTILSKQQMLRMMDGEQLSDGPIRLEREQHAVGGQNFANPKRMSYEEIARDDNGISKDPWVRGNVDFWANSNSPDLYVSDLGSSEGTIIQHNPEFLPPVDPWKGHPLHGLPIQS